LEGLVRREVEAAGARLQDVEHGSLVLLRLSIPAPRAAAFRQRIDDAAQGRAGWPAA
ncbi:DUF1949 domain-containing protein, partial [Paracidovorax cattleyae]